MSAGEEVLGELSKRLALGPLRGIGTAPLIGHTVALLLPLLCPTSQSLGLLRQRLLVRAGEKQVSVLVADPVLGCDLETHGIAHRLVALALENPEPVGSL